MIDVPAIRELLYKVPLPPEDTIPLGVEEPKCVGFEQRTGIHLPADVREWLKISNGPCVGPGGLYGIQTARAHLDIEEKLKMFPSWQVQRWIPIAGDGCGNYYIVPALATHDNEHPVLYIDTIRARNAPSFVVASDMEHFLIAILEKELGAKGWPFNERFVTDHDPHIKRIHGVPLPWESNRV